MNTSSARILALICCLAFAAARSPAQTLYASDPQGNLFQVDPEDGDITTIGWLGISHFSSLATHPASGEIFGLTDEDSSNPMCLYQASREDAAATLKGCVTGFTTLAAIEFSPSADLYALAFDGAQWWLLTLDPETAQPSAASVVPLPEEQTEELSMTFDSAGDLRVSGSSDCGTDPEGEIHLFTVDPADGSYRPKSCPSISRPSFLASSSSSFED